MGLFPAYGRYVQFCHDQGSDIIGGTRLYAEKIQEAEGRRIPIIHDIAHKIANLLKIEAEELGWAEFAEKAAQSKQRLQFTKLAAFCAPNQRSKARYMNLDEQTDWGKTILAYLDKTIDEQSRVKPLREKKSQAALQELLEQVGWVRDYRGMLIEMSELLLVGKIVRHQIRVEGMHGKTVEELEKKLNDLEVGERANQFAGKLIDFVTSQVEGIEQVTLGSTEIIESSFGKLKQLMDEDTKNGFTAYILSLAACIGKLDFETVQAALRTCSAKQVKDWTTENVGETIYTQRRRLFNPFRRRKKKEVSRVQINGVTDHAGIPDGQVVNL